MFTLLRGSNRRDHIYEYRVKYAVITLYRALWKRPVILSTNVGHAMSHDSTKKHDALSF